MTARIKKLIRTRRAVFRKFGRNKAWKSIKNKTRKIIKDRKKNYDKKKKEDIMSGKTNKLHDCVRAFVNNDKKKEWSPRQLYPGKSEGEAAESLAEDFNNISNQYAPLNKLEIPVTYDVDIPVLTPQMITGLKI